VTCFPNFKKAIFVLGVGFLVGGYLQDQDRKGKKRGSEVAFYKFNEGG
jgi:hypothetical protein